MTDTVQEKTSLSLPFFLYKQDEREHAVEKSDSTGAKRRYLRGISSGVRVDGDGERMTNNCVNGMQDQANTGDILLYAGKHGVNFQDDLGILESSELINSRADWFTEYRLFDQMDDVPEEDVRRAEKIWNQVNGLAPYRRPRKLGFSIEATIPEGGILQQKKGEDGRIRRVIDALDLEGVLLVTKPSYQSSIASAVYKALGEYHPAAVENLHKKFQNTFADRMRAEEERSNFYQQYYHMNDALVDSIEQIMVMDDSRKRQRLEILFEDYSQAMIQHILQHGEAFQREQDQRSEVLGKSRDIEAFLAKMRLLQDLVQKRLGGSNNERKHRT